MEIVRTPKNRIYLFDSSTAKNRYVSPLTTFINYLKVNNQNAIGDFAHAGSIETLHHNLNIKDNLLLDSIPTSLNKHQDDHLLEEIQKNTNPYLLRLIDFIRPLNRQPRDLCAKEIKIASIVKALMGNNSQVLFINPEQALPVNIVEIVKQTMAYEVKENFRTLYLNSSDPTRWLDISTDIIYRDSHKKFYKEKNVLCTLKDEEEFSPTFDLTSHKLVG